MVRAYRPASLEEALAIRARESTILYCGGTDLIVQQRSWSGTLPGFPLPILCIGHLAELQAITVDQSSARLGASVTLGEILAHPDIPQFMKTPILEMASPAIRNLASLGGNICNASPAADSLPILYALDAQLTLASTNGRRTLNIRDFLTGPGRKDLRPDEILSEISFSWGEFNRFYYRKLGPRKANAIAKVSFFGAASIFDEQVRDIRLAFGAVGPTVVRSTAGEALLTDVSTATGRTRVQQVMDHYAALLSPIDDVRSTADYRRTVALELLQDFLRKELVQ